MTQRTHPDPSPFSLERGPLGILLIHGYTGSPPEMRLIGDYLAAREITVSAPLLPGHGTTVEEMNARRWTDWTRHCQEALDQLKEHCTTVYVGGLSMGAIITLFLASHNHDIAGAVAYSPAVIIANPMIYATPFLKHFVKKVPKSGESDLTDPEASTRLWSYPYDPLPAAHEILRLSHCVRGCLSQVRCPLLTIHSTRVQRQVE